MSKDNDAKLLKILLLIAGLMLCLAVIPAWPYGFYSLLRLIVCGVAAYTAFKFKNNSSMSAHFIPLLVLAVLFNPLMPVHLTRILWIPIDLGVAVYFLTLSKKV